MFVNETKNMATFMQDYECFLEAWLTSGRADVLKIGCCAFWRCPLAVSANERG